ncbi:TonB-dependent receptor plug domain-containing protein [Salipiger abyssi]|uniref:TonB-dependent receptor plug domain-containing protein n=1 Tax=Salipiger abyssi TaxID=1250539 RepID=UPI001A8EA68D|nr:TonB-dependent receptor plug domain-containing protein [Salipiger abyssi]MBN9889410.1 TonB-dependent receptor plug domain-containing protein [Salipiger abyssi]
MTRSRLRGTTALILLSLCATQGAAQQAERDLTTVPGFLGTLYMTPGKRDLSLGGAVPVTTVDSEEIEDRQAGTIAELIDSVPGVTLINGSTPQGSGINIRGYGANGTYGNDQKIAILVDGASVGSEELYRIGTQLFTDPLLYRQVEVLRGTIGSFEYGSGIVGGVVKLETKDASDFTGGVPGFRVGQSFEFGSNTASAVSSTTLAWQPTERAEFLLNYTWRQQDDQVDGDGHVIGNSGFETPSGLLKGKFTFGQDDAHSVTLSYSRTTADEKDVPYDTFGTTGGSFGNVDRVTETSQTTLEYRYNPLSDLIDLTATLSYADQQIEYSYVPGSSPLEFTPTWPFLRDTVNADQRYETTKLTVKNAALFQTGIVDHTLRAGVELSRREREDNDAASAPGGEDNRVAVFVIDEMRFNGFTLTPALRWEKSEVESATTYGDFENDALMGGVALAYEFGNGLSVFGSYAYTEGLPIIDDLGPADVNEWRMTTSEKSDTWELGASYAAVDVFSPGDNLSLRGSYYQTELWDITSYSATGSTSPNLDRVETEGFELEASYGFANGTYVDFQGSWTEGTEYADGLSDTDWRNKPGDAVGLTLGRKWGDWLDMSWEVRHTTDARDALQEDLPDYTVHNLRATYKPQSGAFEGTEIRFGIENAFDLDYTGNLSSRDAPGRTYKLGLSKVF